MRLKVLINIMTAYLESFINARNNLLISPIFTLLVAMNFIKQNFKTFQLNYKANSFKTTDFKLQFNTLYILIN